MMGLLLLSFLIKSLLIKSLLIKSPLIKSPALEPPPVGQPAPVIKYHKMYYKATGDVAVRRGILDKKQVFQITCKKLSRT